MQLTSYTQNILITLVTCLSFCACQSTTLYVTPSELLLYDLGFVGFEEIQVESEQEIFILDEEAKVFVKATIEPITNKIDQMEALFRAIFDRSDLNLLYQGDANNTANETYHSRTANCLSMSIMTYAMAIEAGFYVDFQEIMIPEF